MFESGAIVRADIQMNAIALLFSGDEFGEGLQFIRKTLKKHKVKASFFFTGRFYRTQKFKLGINRLIKDGHYLGAHSDQHLLYCDWSNRDSLLITKELFHKDLHQNYISMQANGVDILKATYFLPPYEWYNDTISAWTESKGLQLIHFTPGTLSHTDYTTLKDKNYKTNTVIYDSIIKFEQSQSTGLRGFLLLMHIGAGPDRKEKFYRELPTLIQYLSDQGYTFRSVSELLN